MALETAWPRAERRFPAMGTQAHLIVVGPRAAALADAAAARVATLEACWSRFLDDSEISLLNRRAGTAVSLSEDAFRLVDTAATARRLTRGRFDPLLGERLIALGYDRPFAEVAARPAPIDSGAAPYAPSWSVGQPVGAVDNGEPLVVDRAAGTATVAPGRSFDPGGIGKGLAADMIVDELLADGAWGALVNLGGDLRVGGVPPTGETWVVAVDHPHRHPDDGPLTTIELVDGGLATSTTLRRRWAGPEGDRHHLIDPLTGLPHRSGVDFVTVVAGQAWWAEVSATALIGAPASTAAVPAGGAAIVVEGGGPVHRLGPFAQFEQHPTTSDPDLVQETS